MIRPRARGVCRNLIELESLVDVSASNLALTEGNLLLPTYRAESIGRPTAYYGGEDRLSNLRMGHPLQPQASIGNDERFKNVMATSKNAVWAVKGTTGGAGRSCRATGFYVPYVSGDDGTLEKGVGTYLSAMDRQWQRNSHRHRDGADLAQAGQLHSTSHGPDAVATQ